MIDQNSQFMAILTAVGEAKQANADALGVPWTFAQMGVGDAGGTDPIPDRAQTKLINEQRRAPLNQVKIDPKNSNVIIAEQVIPENVGGWWIREVGLYDADDDLVAVANCAPSFKPLLAQGSGKTQVVRMNFIVTSAANVTLKIDPSVVLATRQYVDERLIEVLPPTCIPGSYTKVLIDKRGIVIEGSNPDTLAGNGIEDAYTKNQIDDLLNSQASGRLIGVKTFNTNGTYTPTPGTTSVIVEGVGGGGGSGGLPSTPAGAGCISASGAPGAYAKGRFTAGFTGVAVVIGAAGAAGSNSSKGGAGGTTSFGAVMTIPGGGGSGLGQVGTVTNASGGGPASAPTGGNIIAAAGTMPPFAILAAASIGTLNQSAVSLLGQKGAGAAGGYSPPSSAATVGNPGVSGTLIIWEYA